MDRYALVDDQEQVLCTARDVDGFFVDAAPGRRVFRLVGASLPAGPLGDVALRVLDRSGAAIGAYHVASASASGAEVTGQVFGRAHPLSPELWDLWRDGPLTSCGTWASYLTAGRAAWLEVARLRGHRTVGELVVAGEEATDRPGLYCALGEAVNGPGGYYGANLDALADCLRGGFGPTPPFDLTWRGARTGPDLAKVLDVLAEAKVSVHLDQPV